MFLAIFGNLSRYFALSKHCRTMENILDVDGLYINCFIHYPFSHSNVIIHHIYILSVCVASFLLAKIMRRMSMCTCLWGGTRLEGSTSAAIKCIQRISKNFKESKTRLFPQNPGFSSGPYVFVGFRFFRYKSVFLRGTSGRCVCPWDTSKMGPERSLQMEVWQIFCFCPLNYLSEGTYTIEYLEI